MELWYPSAVVNKATKNAGSYVDGVPFRGILHTTESSTFTPKSDSYGGWHQSYPHFTLVERSSGVTLYQHIPIDTAARALRNMRGGVRTNHVRAIQIEIVTRAAISHRLSDAMVDTLASWMRWVEQQTGVKREAPLPFRGGEAYGLKGKSRMTNQQWLDFDAWCGHQHVPENTHWDPGRINIEELLRRGAPVPTPRRETTRTPAEPAYQVVNVGERDLLDAYAEHGSDKVAFRLAPDAVGLKGTGKVRTERWIELEAADGTTGWVPDHVVALKPEGPAQMQVVGVRRGDTLNVRSGPGSRRKIVDKLQPNATDITATGLAAMVGDDRWLQVRRGSIIGWVHSNYVRNLGSGFESVEDEGPEMDPISHGDFGDLED